MPNARGTDRRHPVPLTRPSEPAKTGRTRDTTFDAHPRLPGTDDGNNTSCTTLPLKKIPDTHANVAADDFGSKASRNASPMKFNATKVTTRIPQGNTISHQ